MRVCPSLHVCIAFLFCPSTTLYYFSLLYPIGCPPASSQVRYLSELGEFVQVGLSVPDDSLLDKFHENDLFMLSGEHPEKVGRRHSEERAELEREGVKRI